MLRRSAQLSTLAWSRLSQPGVSIAKVPKPWRTAHATPGREAAGLVVAKKLVGDDVLRAACVEIAKLRFDRDADSVDGSPTFEVSWVRQGKYCHSGLARVFKQTIEEKLTPLIRSVSHLHGMADSRGLVLCDALVRSYDEGQRRQHPAHYDSQALVTAVLEVDMGCGGFEGPGFYVQPDAHVSSRLPITMSSGDVIAHSFDLQHGVEVHSGRRCSVIFWFADSSASCASGAQPWYHAAASCGDADAQYNLSCHYVQQADAARAVSAADVGTWIVADHQTAPTAPAKLLPLRAQELMRASAVQGHFLAQLAHGIMLVHAEMEARGVSDHASLLRSYRASGEDFFRSEVYLESERWIRSSADRGYYRAMVHLHSRRLEQAEHVAGLVQSAGRQVHGQVEPVEAIEMASQQAAHTAEALQWLTRAAEQRADPATMYALAVAHRDGSYGCTTVDVATARHWFKAAAKMGHPPSQFEMGKLGGPEAEKWLQLASHHGVGDSSRALALLYARRGEATKLMRLFSGCVGRLLQGSSKVSAAALPHIPLAGGV